MDGCHSSIGDKKKRKVYVAKAAEEGPAEVYMCVRKESGLKKLKWRVEALASL